MSTKKLWTLFSFVILTSFSVLLWFGRDIYIEKPPIPTKVVTEDGNTLFTKKDILDGQNVWQSTGGQELGSIWGHGSYVAPDWTADWLHREVTYLLSLYAEQEFSTHYDSLDKEKQALLQSRLQTNMRKNTYNPTTQEILVSTERAEAIQANSSHYKKLFMGDPSLKELRNSYAMREKTLLDEGRMNQLNAFFFWATWATVTQRPNQEITYSNNWPPDELVGNKPTSSLILWTGFSVILLLAGIGLLSFYYATQQSEDNHTLDLPHQDPLLNIKPTPSMQATLKYFWIVSSLMLVQIILGVITAHYGVEGQAFYGIPLAELLPYSITRTWHVQLAIFWIATSWLATGLYIAPAIAGKEPRFQSVGVNILFGALLVIVVGSLVGQWFGIMQKLGLTTNFWFGHQGYEYVDLGRFWQIFLFAGLLIWLALMVRALWPALTQKSDQRNLLMMFVLSSVAIALFYGAGFMWGQHTHLAIAEYWRWWVVHLWVEGFFEVFATVVIAFLFVRLGLVSTNMATVTVLFSTIIFLAGGIIGTFHHLYFTGTPTSVMALGATFSALEVVPLVLMGFEAYHNYKISRATQWLAAYKWPIYCFISVAFWNFLGAGIFGFLINPPIALYYMQGLNTTPVHGHTALFGVYGMLGIGLMLFVLRSMTIQKKWNDKAISIAFWSINMGLILMVLLSVLPVGLAQTWVSVKYGLWFARSADFLQDPALQKIRWLRAIGDTVFAIGAVALCWFIAGLKTGWSFKKS